MTDYLTEHPCVQHLPTLQSAAAQIPLRTTPNNDWLFGDNGRIVVAFHHTDHEGRGVYTWEVWIGGDLVDTLTDLRTGVGMDRGPVAMLATLASFLGACAESGEAGENSDLFIPRIREWASLHSDDLAMLTCEIEEA